MVDTLRAPERRATPRPREQSRARYPDRTGFVDRARRPHRVRGYGSGDPPIVFVPPWQIVHSRVWKAQIPAFARRHLVVAWDNLGNGRSDRPMDPAVHTTSMRAANLEAVMDAAGLARAVLVASRPRRGRWSCSRSQKPDRVRGLVFVCPAAPIGAARGAAGVPFDERLPNDEGWNKENIHFWRRDYRAYLEHFFTEAFPEPHSTKQIDDGVGWGLDTDPETLGATLRTPPTVDAAAFAAMCASIRAPALVIQGTDDRITTT